MNEEESYKNIPPYLIKWIVDEDGYRRPDQSFLREYLGNDWDSDFAFNFYNIHDNYLMADDLKSWILLSNVQKTAQHPLGFEMVTDKPGIYFLFDDGVLVYIGKAKVIRNRISNHYDSDKDFTHFTFTEYGDEPTAAIMGKISEDEIKYIQQFRPKYNIAYNRVEA